MCAPGAILSGTCRGRPNNPSSLTKVHAVKIIRLGTTSRSTFVNRMRDGNERDRSRACSSSAYERRDSHRDLYEWDLGSLWCVHLIRSSFLILFSDRLGVDAILEIRVRISDRGSAESRASGRSSHLRLWSTRASSRIARVDSEFNMAGKILSLVKMKHEAKSNIDETERINNT